VTSLDPDVAARLKRSADGLVPAIVQQHDTGEVLMLGWMDDEALARTLASGRATYWSRSRQEYWIKGETSGHRQWVKEVRLDCDADTLLVKVDQEGAACHTGDRTCFDADVLPLRVADVSDPDAVARATDPLGMVGDAGEMPLAGALSLVLLACWGVLLVTRGRFRRIVAWLALLASVGLVVTVVVGFATLGDQLADTLAERTGTSADSFSVGLAGWFWAAAVAALASLAAAALAVRWVRYWPEMGSRYDAPGAAADSVEAPLEDRSNLDLWKAMDEGHDPTERPAE
jgi:phosphoribosyl-AMP cyclohydrolase